MSLPKKIQTSVNVATAAATVSVDATTAKAFLKVEHSDDDTLIGNLTYAAEAEVEAYTNRKLISQTVDFYLTEFPPDGIVLPFSPVTSITSVKYYDTSGNLQTWNSANYHYNIYEEPCVIRYVNSAPDTYDDKSDAVVVRFVTGYTNQAALPEGLVYAVLLKLGDLYENRVDAPREAIMTSWRRSATPYIVFHEPNENQ